MNIDVCPDRDLLTRHLMGKVHGSEAEWLDRHLAICPNCVSAAETLRSDDELTAAMRATRLDREGDTRAEANVIDRGKQLRGEAETMPVEETQEISTGSYSQAARVETEDLELLGPAEGPDELGRIGGYRVLDVLGVGGMGVVFRAEDPQLKRLVAIKAIKRSAAATKTAKERFLREAQATAAIEHENIVTIHQVGEEGGVPFIAMPLLRGESLQTALDRGAEFETVEIARIGQEIAAGLAAAHERRLIHRDIKPDNIWIEEGSGRVKILDFGLVRSMQDEAELTQTGVVIGTPRYMAPEQVQGQSVDHRCDIFSLGSVLYRLLSKRNAFDGDNLTATLIAVAHQAPVPLDEVCPNADRELASTIQSLLQKNVDERPQEASFIRDQLHAIRERFAGGAILRSCETSAGETGGIVLAKASLVAQRHYLRGLRTCCVRSSGPIADAQWADTRQDRWQRRPHQHQCSRRRDAYDR